MNHHRQAHLALFVVNLIYGLNYVVAKGLMPGSDGGGVIAPSGFILLRIIGATVLFWALFALRPQRVTWPDLLRILGCAVFGVAINQLFFFHGLMRTSAVNSSIIMVATPILVLAMSGLLIGERITRMKLLGVALGACGALSLVFLKGEAGSLGTSLTGDLFILINASAFAVYLVLVKPLMSRYSAVTIMSWAFLFGLCMVAPLGWRDLAAVAWPSFGMGIWLALGFVVIMVTFVAYLLNTWALRHVNPGVVGTYIYMQPVLATLFGALLAGHGERLLGFPIPPAELGAPQLLSAAAIFLGVHLVGRADRVR